MSYYLDPHYYKNVPSYETSDLHVPVPGWGKSARAAGPEMIGVGALKTIAKSSFVRTMTSAGPPPEAEGSWFPWWGWMAVPLAVGGAALFAADMGWFGRKAKAVAAGG
jgi:hypothetical protein